MMRIFELLCISMLVGVCGCSSNNVRIKGEIVAEEARITLSSLSTETGDTVVLAVQEVNAGKIDLRTDKLHVPALVWLDVLGKDKISFIVDASRKIRLKWEENDSCAIVVEGSVLEQEREKVIRLLEKKYDKPMAEIKQAISEIERKVYREAGDEANLRILQQKLKRYQWCRFEFVRKMVEVNPAHELSLFLTWEMLQDSVNVQKQLLETMQIEHKESDIYRLLVRKCQ